MCSCKNPPQNKFSTSALQKKKKGGNPLVNERWKNCRKEKVRTHSGAMIEPPQKWDILTRKFLKDTCKVQLGVKCFRNSGDFQQLWEEPATEHLSSQPVLLRQFSRQQLAVWQSPTLTWFDLQNPYFDWYFHCIHCPAVQETEVEQRISLFLVKLIHQKASRMLSILNDRAKEYEPYLTQIRAMEGYDLFLRCARISWIQVVT